MAKMDEPKTGVRYFSVAIGHRLWFFTGRVNRNITPLHPEVTYQFKDICDCVRDVTLENFNKYFEVR